MAKYLSPFLLVFVLSSNALAQKKEQLVSLEEQLLQKKYPSFQIVEVIDERKNKANIGWVQMSMFNVKHFADFDQPLEHELMSLIRRSGEKESTAPEVKMGVRHLYISERTGAFTESAIAELEVMFYTRNEEGNWVPVWKAFSDQTLNKGGDVTKKHPENITAAIEEVLEIFAQSNWTDNIQYPLFASGEEKKTDIQEIPVFTATSHPSGIFETFKEFRENNPGRTGKLKMKQVYDMPVILWEYDENGKRRNTKKKDYFGFAYENKLFVKLDRGYYEIEQREDGFYFTGPRTSDANATSVGAAGGGLIGAAIASSATSHKVLYRIDMENGRFLEIEKID